MMAKDQGARQVDGNRPEARGDLTKSPVAPKTAEVPFERIEAAVKSVRFGVVQLIIQDGRVIQIDKTEKIRLV